MYYMASKMSDNKYLIEDTDRDWHAIVDSCEPIDCVNGNIIIFDDKGKKYFVGPNQEFPENKLILGLKSANVGKWDFEKGEPYLIDSKENASTEFKKLLYEWRAKNGTKG